MASANQFSMMPPGLEQMLAAGMMATWLAAPLSAAETKADNGQSPAESVATAAQAASGKVDDATQTAIRNGLQRLMAGNTGMKIEEIRPTPIPGLYEVQVGQILVYADGAGKYVLAALIIFWQQNPMTLFGLPAVIAAIVYLIG